MSRLVTASKSHLMTSPTFDLPTGSELSHSITPSTLSGRMLQ